MASEWPIVRLGDYVDSNLGKMLDAQKNKGVPRPYLGNSNVRWGSFDLTDLALMKFEKGEDERYGIRDGDLIVCEGGEPGRCAIWREQVPDMKIQKALHRIRPKEGLNNYYLFYWFMLAGRAGWLEPFFTGTTIKHLTGKALSDLKVTLPPIEEQRAIAHILGTLDDKIELNRQQNETLEAMARALFKAWFVDFEPVRAKLEGRWQRGQSLPGLPAHLYDLFPDRLVESELGEIPEGWKVMSLSEYSVLNPESWTKRTRPEQIRYVDLSNTKWGHIESVTNYEANDAPSRAQRVLRPLDTIFGTVRPGNGSYALISDEGLTGSTGFAVLRPLRRECSEFVYLAATSRENIERLSNLADGGAYPAVRPEIVSATQVTCVGQELIKEFSQQVSPMLAGIADNERTSQTLALLRDTLLPKLISGDLRVGAHGRAPLPPVVPDAVTHGRAPLPPIVPGTVTQGRAPLPHVPGVERIVGAAV